MKTKTFKRLLASILAFLMLFGGALPSALAEEIDSLYTEISGDGIQQEDEMTDEAIFDAQPATLAEVWEVITAYEIEYNAVLDELGIEEALKVQKPHWEFEVPEEIMPDGYCCKLVDDDEDFDAEYYTFIKDADNTEDEDEINDIEDEDEIDNEHDEDEIDDEDGEIQEIVYDPQPQSIAEVQAAIDAYESEYLAVLEAEGFLAALEVWKPHWQYEVLEEIMPYGWHCELVDWDEDFGAEYYTFFPNPVAVADGPPYGDGQFVNEPPKGTNITDVFNIVTDAGDASLDSQYNNVAILTMDEQNQFGGMWSKETLDMSLPFKTEMQIHLGHDYNNNGQVADGMTFTLQADGPDAIGGMGEGLGVYHGRTSGGVSDARWLKKAISIEFDTYRNPKDGQGKVEDPSLPGNGNTAHCALILSSPTTGQCLIGNHQKLWWFNPTQDWEKFEVEWEPTITNGVLGGTLTYSFMGVKSTYEIEDISSIFGDTTNVYWGFTGATGGLTSVQAAAIIKLPTQGFNAEKSVENAGGVSVDGGEARVGDVLSYSITVTAEAVIDEIGPVVITDELSSYVEFAGDKVRITTSDGSDFEVEPDFTGDVMTIETGCYLSEAGDWITATFDVIVLESGLGKIVDNTAVIEAENLTDPLETNTTEVEIIDSSKKLIDESSEAGKDGKPVSVGDIITYRIEYYNPTGETADLTITDNLDLGLDYVDCTGGGIYDTGSRAVTWKFTGVPEGGTGYVTLTVKVNTNVEATILNIAQMEWDTGDGDPQTEDPEIEIPVGSYKIVDEESGAGVDGESVTVGDLITYRICYINSSGEDAELTITDFLDKGLAFVSCTGGGSYDDDAHTVTWSIGKVGAGESGFVTLIAKVTTEAGAFVTNKAELEWITEGGEPDTEEPEVTNPVFPYKIVDESSAAGIDGAAVRVGDVITFRIGYVNPTGVEANLTITDELDEALTYIECSTGGIYEENTHTVTWEMSNVEGDGTGFVTLTVQVNENAVSTVKNIAQLVWVPVEVGEEVEEKPEIEIPVASYKIVDSDSDNGVNGAPVTLDDEIIYRIGYINPTGEIAALTITDELPTGLVFVRATDENDNLLTGYNEASRSIEWTISGVAAGGSGYVTLTAKVTEEAGAFITNKSNLKWLVPGEEPEIEDPEVTNPVFPYKIVDLDSEAGAGGAPVTVGDEVTFHIGYNNTTGAVAELTITDVLPVGLTYVDSSNDGINDSGTVTWVINNVPAGDKGFVTLTVLVNEDASHIIKNIADLLWDPADGDPKEESAEVDVTVVSYKIVDITSDAGKDGAAVNIGDIITYRIGYINPTGEIADLKITDRLDPGLEFVSATDENGGSLTGYDDESRSIEWTISGVSVEGHGYVTLTVMVNANAGAIITNVAEMEWYIGDNVIETEDPEIDIPVGSYKLVDSSSESGKDGTSVSVGDEITYKIGYVNPTGETASLIITDELDSGLTFVDCSDDGDYDPVTHKVTWDIGEVAAGGNGYVTLTVRVNAKVGELVRNVAHMEWDTGGDEPDIEEPEIEIPIGSYKIVDGGSAAGVDGATVKVGDIITYRIGYVNPTSEIAKLTITDELDPGLKFVSATDENGGSLDGFDADSTAIIWEIEDVLPEGKGYVTLTVRVTVDAGALITNTAHMEWETGDDPYIEEPKVENPVGSYKIVDEESEAGVDGASVTVGDEITYRIRYSNPMGEIAKLTITDKLPVGLEYVDSDGTYDEAENKVVWIIDNVPANDYGDVTLTVRVTVEAGAFITNKAELEWVTEDEEPTEEPEVTNPVFPYKIVDTDSEAGVDGASVAVGDVITFRIGYVNPIGYPATLIITDELAVGLTYIGSSNDGSYDPQSRTVTWNMGTVEDDGIGYVTLDVQVNENAVAIIKNVADLSWIPIDEGDSKDEHPEVEVPVGSYKIVDGSSAAGVDGAVVRPGDVITYRIGYVNPTGETAKLTITDNLNSGLTFVECSDGGSYEASTHSVTWTFDSIAPGGIGYVTLEVRVNEYAEVVIRNTAEITWDTGGEDPDIEEPEVENPVGSYKIVAGDSESGVDGAAVRPGDVVTYKIGYVNPTGEEAKLVITDELDDGLNYVSCSRGGDYNEETRTVTWTIDPVAAGEASFVTLTVRVNENAKAVVKNTAIMSWYTGGEEPSEIEDPEVENPVLSYKIVDESSESGKDGAPVTVGNEITYRIGYVNPKDGPAKLTITDKLDPGLTYVSCEDGGIYDAGSHTVTWEIGEVAAEGTGYVTLTVRVNENAGALVKNRAHMEWKTGDGTSEEDPEIEIPVGSFKVVDSSSAAGVNGASVKPGDTITYKIGYVNPTGEDAELIITDTLDAGLTFESCTGDGIYEDASRTVTWTISEVLAGDAGYVTLTVKVNENAGAVIKNTAIMSWYTGGEEPSEVEEPEVDNPVGSYKIVAGSSASGVNGAQVNIGDEITYRIGYVNPTGEPAKLIITDTLETGLTYLSCTDGGVYRSDTRTVTWIIDPVSDDGAGYVTLVVRVNESAGAIVKNVAQMIWDTGDGNPDIEKPETENPVKPADRLYTVTYKANGGVGEYIVRNLPYGTRHTVLTRGATEIYRNNYRFIGWNTQPNGRGIAYAPGDIIFVTSDIILYAQWERITSPTKPSTDKPSTVKQQKDTATKLDTDNHFAYIIGYPDKTVGPEKNITRAEAATIFFRLLTQETREEMWATTNSYTDVSPDAWYNNAVSTLTKAGVLTGYSDGSFAPNKAISRAEFAAIAVRFVETSVTAKGAAFSDVNGHWAERDINLAATLGYIEGYVDGTYRPNQPISRAEVATLLNRVLNRRVESREDLLYGMVTWPDNNIANWYYYDIQEATNSHYYERKGDGINEIWTQLRPVPDWSLLEKPGAKPWDVRY